MPHRTIPAKLYYASLYHIIPHYKLYYAPSYHIIPGLHTILSLIATLIDCLFRWCHFSRQDTAETSVTFLTQLQVVPLWKPAKIFDLQFSRQDTAEASVTVLSIRSKILDFYLANCKLFHNENHPKYFIFIFFRPNIWFA